MILLKTMSPQHPNCNQECTIQFRKWSSMSCEPFCYFQLMQTWVAARQRHVFRLDAVDFLYYAPSMGGKEIHANAGRYELLISEPNFHKYSVEILSVLIEHRKIFSTYSKDLWFSSHLILMVLQPQELQLELWVFLYLKYLLPILPLGVAWVYLHCKTLNDHPNSFCVLKILCETHLKPHSQGVSQHHESDIGSLFLGSRRI